mmetsp:Transcript_14639/g.42858  ORF Transcript_14639/g.42858 Transcript_14639/m.42858 type:complete len:205 (+) Transcript_14639:1653-2267(+)
MLPVGRLRGGDRLSGGGRLRGCGRLCGGGRLRSNGRLRGGCRLRGGGRLRSGSRLRSFSRRRSSMKQQMSDLGRPRRCPKRRRSLCRLGPRRERCRWLSHRLPAMHLPGLRLHLRRGRRAQSRPQRSLRPRMQRHRRRRTDASLARGAARLPSRAVQGGPAHRAAWCGRTAAPTPMPTLTARRTRAAARWGTAMTIPHASLCCS